ncbi:MAG: hypothetical protein K2O64_02535, partial [Lactobacillus sp.]|nr:hypothetical protein [Lactobacillus sp.]
PPIATQVVSSASSDEYQRQGMFVYLISFLPERMSKYMLWLPSPYLNITKVFNGTLANVTELSFINCLIGAFVLIIWSLILIVSFRTLVDKGRNG